MHFTSLFPPSKQRPGPSRHTPIWERYPHHPPLSIHLLWLGGYPSLSDRVSVRPLLQAIQVFPTNAICVDIIAVFPSLSPTVRHSTSVYSAYLHLPSTVHFTANLLSSSKNNQDHQDMPPIWGMRHPRGGGISTSSAALRLPTTAWIPFALN